MPKEPGSNLQKWGTYELDTANQEALDLAHESGSASFMKLKVGKNIIRILPPLPEKKSPFFVTYQHYIRTPNDDKPFAFSCPRLVLQIRCPACDEWQRLRKSSNRKDQERSKEFFPKRRVFCNVINRAEPETGPMVLAFGKTIHEELIALRQDEDAGGDFTHPINGIDVVIERTGVGKFDTDYAVRLARRSTPISDDASVMDAWREAMHDLESFAKLPSDEEIKARLNGEDYEDEDKPRDSGASRRRPRGKAPARASVDADISDAEFTEVDGEDHNEDWGV